MTVVTAVIQAVSRERLGQTTWREEGILPKERDESIRGAVCELNE